jgi:hypothetical protein
MEAFPVLIISRLYFIMSVGYLVSTMNGFDGSLMGAVNAMIPYQETFHLSGAGMSVSDDGIHKGRTLDRPGS